MSSNATHLVENQPGKIEAAIPEISNTVTPLDQLGDKPEYIDCPFCHRRVLTKVIKTDSGATSMAACCCCIFIGLLGVWIPFVFRWFPDIDHFCTDCGQRVLHKPHAGPMEVKGPAFTPAQAAMQYAPMPEQKGPPLDQGWSDGQGNTDGIVPQKQASEMIMPQKEESSIEKSGQQG